MEETWTVGAVPDDVEDVAERVTSMARLKRRHTQAIETERRLAQKTEALQSTLEASGLTPVALVFYDGALSFVYCLLAWLADASERIESLSFAIHHPGRTPCEML